MALLNVVWPRCVALDRWRRIRLRVGLPVVRVAEGILEEPHPAQRSSWSG
jgi:hypothetical protein